MPFVYVDDLKETILRLKKKQIKSYAAHLDGKHTYDKEDYKQGTAFLIGNEGNGLREEIAECARVLGSGSRCAAGRVLKCGSCGNRSDV